eukprot:819277-Amphidinium_carterae.1
MSLARVLPGHAAFPKATENWCAVKRLHVSEYACTSSCRRTFCTHGHLLCTTAALRKIAAGSGASSAVKKRKRWKGSYIVSVHSSRES